MSHELIKQLFEARLTQYAEANNYRVHYQNKRFEAKARETYFRSYIVPTYTGSMTLSGDHRVYRGLYHVSIITPPDIGTTLASILMEEVEQLFPLYQPIYEDEDDPDSFFVTPITPFDRPEGFVNPTEYLLPASFQYRADVEFKIN